jgi:hypothetical protein
MLYKTILLGIVLLSSFSIQQAWAQDSSSIQNLVFNTFFSDDSRMLEFLLFVIGISIYSLFVWYFYRFISKRDLLPKFFYPITSDSKVKPRLVALYGLSYIVVFPAVTFVWFIVLAFFVFFLSSEMPFEVALFVSMAVIAVVRILSYYREDAAKEIAKMIPYAILSFVLTSVALYSDPNFFTEKQLASIPGIFIDRLGGVISAMAVVTVFEFGFRIAFLVKRKFFPVSDKILEEKLETQVEAIAKAYFKKMEEKEKELEKKLDELHKKLDESK